MDELIKQLTQRVGIPADKAKIAADTVLGFLKSKLPAPVAGQLDTVLGGPSKFAEAAKGIGELVGSKK